DFEAQAKADEGSLEGIDMSGFGNRASNIARLPYVTASLVRGEEIVRCGRVHWAVFISPVFIILLGMIFLIAGQSLNSPRSQADLQKVGSQLFVASCLFFCLGLVTLASAFVHVSATELAVTTQRIVAKQGLISRRTLEMNVAKVENIQVDQSVLGRLLGFGKI